MVVDVLGFDFMITTMTLGEKFKRHRYLFHKYFKRLEHSKYNGAQLIQVNVFLRDLLKEPESFRTLIHRSSAAVVLRMLYGHDVATDGDKYVELAAQVTAAITKAGPFGTFKVDYIPWLRFVPSWMPGAGWKREALESRKKARQLLNEPFAQAKADLISGQEAICMVTTELEALMNGDKNHNMNVDEEVIKNTAATAFTAGAETVVSILSSFFLVLTKFPAVQQRAQEEVDRVLGGRLPTIEDRGRLPLIQSMVYELLRWNPVTPIGLPHYASEMDTYGGYTIPEGTTVIPNLWRMLHDPVAYPEPNTFKIDRFLNRILANETHVRDKNARERAGPRGVNSIPDAAIFGAGRRACPGKYIAHDFIFLMVTSVLATFQVTRAVNEAGQEIDPNPRLHPFPRKPSRLVPLRDHSSVSRGSPLDSRE
ncbi:cytochrome P450 [Ephemerocybe angulata]|uniref:Cytochrome P450 n=1 Tax=Ephemerocybe angulata TaxID=980116 RepID=A0A8H6MED5_9AGAR|nr:cytochrome P450 [Tulosesus angulatus]